ncbi:MAG: class I SAM-dependent methyltransferase [bacterium]|nr:class I SAM-dependent methyltransferase [bacterium]
MDSSRSSLKLAHEKLSKFENVTLTLADAYDLTNSECPDLQGEFDLLFAADFYSHIPISKLPDFFCSTKKLLRPGGQMIMVT